MKNFWDQLFYTEDKETLPERVLLTYLLLSALLVSVILFVYDLVGLLLGEESMWGVNIALVGGVCILFYLNRKGYWKTVSYALLSLIIVGGTTDHEIYDVTGLIVVAIASLFNLTTSLIYFPLVIFLDMILFRHFSLWRTLIYLWASGIFHLMRYLNTRYYKEIGEIKQAYHKGESQLQNIFNHAAVSIWEEDFTAVKAALEELEAQGVTDMKKYLDNHPGFLDQAAMMIKVNYVNQQTLSMFGAETKEELLGSLNRIFTPETKEILKEELLAIHEGKTYFQGETVNRTLDGEDLNVLLTMSIPKETSQLDQVLVSLMDITERKSLQQEIDNRRHYLESLLEAVPDAIVTVDEKNHIKEWNKGAEALFGYAAEEAMGHNLDRLVTANGDVYEEAVGYTEQVLEEGKTLKTMERVRYRKDGTPLNVLIAGAPIKQEGKIVGLVAVYTDITERVKAEQEVERQLAQLESLREVEQALVSTLDVNEILNTLMEILQRVVPHDSMSIMLLREDDVLEIMACRGFAQPETIKAGISFPLDPQFPNQRVIQTQEPVVFADITQEYPHFKEEKYTSVMGQIRSWLGIPLIVKEKVIGMFTIDRSKISPFSENEIQVANSFATQTALALENAHLYQEAQNRAQEFMTLYEMAQNLTGEQDLSNLLQTLVVRASELFDVPVSSIYLYDEARDELEIAAVAGYEILIDARLKMGEGMAGIVAKTREPLYVENYQTWEGRSEKYEEIPFSSVLEVPMLYTGELIGVLTVEELAPKTRQFTKADIRLLSLLAASAAGAVHNARLFESERQQAVELTRLRRASDTLFIEATRDLQVVANNIVEAIIKEFKHSNCSLLLVNEHTREIQRLATAGPYTEEVIAGVLSLDGAGLVPKAIHSEKIINIPDVTVERDYVPNWKAARSEMAIPLKAGEQVIGAIDVQSSQLAAFTPDDERLLSLFAGRAALTLENMRLFERAQRHLSNLSSLRTIDKAISGVLDLGMLLRIILGQVRSQLEVDAANILLHDPYLHLLEFSAGQGFNTGDLHDRKLRLGEGWAGEAALERRLLLIENLDSEETSFEFSPQLKKEGFKSYYVMPLIAKGQVKGVIELYQRRAFKPDEEWFDFLETLAGQIAIAIDNAELFSGIQKAHQNLALAYDDTLEGWARALEYRDMETEGHSRRVTEIAIQLGRALGMRSQDLLHLRRGALLHDIGKMAIPDHILRKPGSLTEEEWDIMHQHPVYAFEMLKSIDYLHPALDIPYYHHEKWDGSGYPNNLKEEQIPLAARIFAVVDVYDALTSDRPYRDAWPEEKALDYIQEKSGKHFDPEVVEAFFQLLKSTR